MHEYVLEKPQPAATKHHPPPSATDLHLSKTISEQKFYTFKIKCFEMGARKLQKTKTVSSRPTTIICHLSLWIFQEFNDSIPSCCYVYFPHVDDAVVLVYDDTSV